MATLSLSQAFANFGARLKNVQWAVSSVASDGTVILSCWQHYFGKAADGALPYSDRLSRWRGPGNTLLREHLTAAFAAASPIKAVVVATRETAIVDSGADASTVKKAFHPLEGFVGRIAEFDGDRFVIQFRKSDGL